MALFQIEGELRNALMYFGDFCSIGGLLAAFAIGRKNHLVGLFKRLVAFDFHPLWALLTILIPVSYMTFAFTLGTYMEFGVLSDIDYSKFLIVFSSGGLAMLLTGPLGEEFGWRGFLLPKLLESFNPLVASIIIGFLWGIWHYPLYYNDIYGAWGSALVFTTHTILASIIMTAIYLQTKGNMLLPILYHWLMNVLQFAFMIAFSLAEHTYDVYQNIGELIIVVILLLTMFRKLTIEAPSNLLFMKKAST